MAHTGLIPRYTIELSANEFRVLTLALGGILKDDEDVALARELNIRLCEQRVAALKDLTRVAEAAHSNSQRLPIAVDTSVNSE